MNLSCDPRGWARWWSVLPAWLALICCLPLPGRGQTLDIQDAVKTYAALTNTVVTLSGRAELRVSGTGDPIPGCVIHLNSPDAWLLMPEVLPSKVASTLLSRVRVNGANAVLDGNVRVAQYAQGAVVIPQAPDFAPLEVFSGRYFTSASRRLSSYVAYNNARLGTMAAGIGSFKLKRGYMATLAQQENGTGISRVYIAQDGDLEVGRLPVELENAIRFVRVFPWRWVAKKGVAGNIYSPVKAQWWYNWNLDRTSPLDVEYVAIRQTRWWPGLGEDWQYREVNHLLGYNEPDSTAQANIALSDALASWPDLLGTGLRVGSPATTDGGRSSWLYPFIQQADAAGMRVDFVAVHYYWCYNPADPAGAASQMYNFLKATYDQVKRPLWVTEWNNGANWTGCADPTYAQQQAAVAAMIEMLDNAPFVERYAIYNWVEDVRRVVWDDNWPTDAGVTYRDHISPLSYRQEMADAGVGSSARYSFDGDTHDGWGNGQDAMSIGAPAFTPGRFGQAIELNGATDYLQLSPRLADSTDWTFAGWVYWNGGANWQRIFDFGEDTSHYLYLCPKTGAGNLRFAINDGSGEQQLSAAGFTAGTWTHVAVTIAGSTGKMFVNGVAVATNTAMTLNPIDVGTRFNFLGKSRFSADPLFSGKFDDFRFISSSLTDAQVAAIAAIPPPQFRAATLYKPDAQLLQPYSATLAGDATGTGPLTYSRMDGPAWLTVAASGALAGTPGQTNGGVNSFLVRVTDTNGSLHTAALLISVPNLTATLAASADDAEQSAAGAVNLTSTDLELVNDDASGAGNQLIGLRFTGLAIPPGAIVTNATIQFTADEAQSEATQIQIQAEAADDAATFAAVTNNLSARLTVPLRAAWTPAAWSVGESNATQRTPNLAGLVQEVVSRPGWVSGNAVVFLLSGTGHRTADAFDKTGGFPPRLTVAYVSPTPTYVASATVSSSANDAEQAAAGAVTLNSTDLELVNDGAQGDQTIGLRFENLPLTAGCLIESADIQFAADEAQSEATALVIRAQAADHAALFTTNANSLTARPLTAATVAWAPVAWAMVGEREALQRTPDLSALVREVVSRPGWSGGNALAFLISGTGHRTADAADKAGGSPATLTVRYRPEAPVGSYLRWAAAHPGAVSLAADPDGDGYNNLLEYALGLDPAVADRNVPRLSLDPLYLHFTYTRPTLANEVTYQVEWADNVVTGPWRTIGFSNQILSDDGTLRTIRASLLKGATGRRFVRLVITY
jgi:hypothetical protein